MSEEQSSPNWIRGTLGKIFPQKPTSGKALNASASPYDPKLLEWHPPLWEDHRTLQEVYDELMSFGNDQTEVPLIVRLVENPEYHFNGLGFFKGRVTLKQHDIIHILLGRGTMLADEAFVLGFTMGSTDRVSPLEETLFKSINNIFYPKAYRFTESGQRIFKEAIWLGYISDCDSLDIVDFEPMMSWPLKDVRAHIRLETDLLQSYYRVEARRYPKSKASQRLIPRGLTTAPEGES